jgi:hypothetical protein
MLLDLIGKSIHFAENGSVTLRLDEKHGTPRIEGEEQESASLTNYTTARSHPLPGEMDWPHDNTGALA